MVSVPVTVTLRCHVTPSVALVPQSGENARSSISAGGSELYRHSLVAAVPTPAFPLASRTCETSNESA